jgi:hypothetical protein
MQTIDARAHSDADATTLYALLLDGATWPIWSPLRSYNSEESHDSERSIRVFRTGRITSRERVVQQVPDRRFSYELVSGLPLRGYRADIDLTPVGSGGTDIRWHSTFRAKVPGTGWLYRVVLGRFIQRCVDGLAAHAARSRASQ